MEKTFKTMLEDLQLKILQTKYDMTVINDCC